MDRAGVKWHIQFGEKAPEGAVSQRNYGQSEWKPSILKTTPYGITIPVYFDSSVSNSKNQAIEVIGIKDNARQFGVASMVDVHFEQKQISSRTYQDFLLFPNPTPINDLTFNIKSKFIDELDALLVSSVDLTDPRHWVFAQKLRANSTCNCSLPRT